MVGASQCHEQSCITYNLLTHATKTLTPAQHYTHIKKARTHTQTGQSIGTMNALAALVSYLPAADPSLFTVKEGNSQLPKRLIGRMAAGGWGRLEGGRGVREVRQLADGRFVLNITGGNETGE
jgi:hypothetical protein